MTSGLSAPIFRLGEHSELATEDSYTRLGAPKGELAMTGPSISAPSGNLPVRGDLAHIRLAGRYFVPHYSVPMQHQAAKADTAVLASASADAETLCTLAEGARFDVLDMAGGWAWGQVMRSADDEDGAVGYVALDQLQAIAS